MNAFPPVTGGKWDLGPNAGFHHVGAGGDDAVIALSPTSPWLSTTTPSRANRRLEHGPRVAGLVSGWSTTGVPVGRSGATTPHAGGITTILYVTVFNGLVNVDQLVQTNSCAEAGDSGGPDWSGHSALGIAAMTDGRGCAPLDPVMYYYSKVNVALARYGGWIITA